MTLDTVKNAEQTPDAAQPWAALGLKEDEYAPDPRDPRPPPHRRRARHVLGDVVRALLVQVSSKVHLQAVRREGPAVRRDAGRHRRERRRASTSARATRSPSRSSRTTTRRYVEPYQGAATGVGGIVRDILTMGARPVAVMDPLRFGAADAPGHRAGCCPASSPGIGGYGNCLGLPNIGGEVVFDPCYQGNPLVNALVRRRHAARGHPAGQGPGAGQPGHPVRRPDRRRRHRRRLGAGLGDLRRRRPGQAPERPGRRPVHRRSC